MVDNISLNVNVKPAAQKKQQVSECLSNKLRISFIVYYISAGTSAIG